MFYLSKSLKAAAVLALLGTSGTFGAAQAETVLNRDMGVELKTLDIQKMHLLAEHEFAADLFDGLLIRDADGNIKPGVAESWDVSEDGLIYTFKLRDSQWSNGDAVTAGDFVFAIRRILSPELASKYASTLYPITGAKAFNKGESADPDTIGAEAIDDKTLKITLSSPTSYFLDVVTTTAMLPLHQASVSALGSEYAQPGKLISNGPFLLTESRPKEFALLTKNEAYWDAAEVALDKVYYYQITDEATAVRKFRAGEVDITRGSQGDNNAWASQNMPEAVQNATILGTEWYDLGHATPAIQDSRVRRAINMAIDRFALTEDILQTGEQPAFGLVPPGIPGYENASADWADLSYIERLEEARKLMEEAGYGPDKKLEFTINFNSSELHRKSAVALADMLGEIYIDASPYNRDSSAYWDWLISARGEYGLARDSWVADYPDPVVFLELYMGPLVADVNGNIDETYDALMNAALAETDTAKRMAGLAAAEARLMEVDTIVPLYHYNSVRLVNPQLTGWGNNPYAMHPSRYIAFK
ncbi:peptide ABC transporter substrate-binding protein [Shimia sp. SDUM112013]|uniref:peptide ABC transporter substrate-binding protein n=1 Tax=Shimia sp. SDUM112013 TaxID=3136160 RepID=UPI0032F006D9